MSAEESTTSERRGQERAPIDGTVTVAFEHQEVIGPGQNMSDEGVFFVANASLKVRIQIHDTEQWREGEVVRVQSMGEGRLGMAIRFC